MEPERQLQAYLAIAPNATIVVAHDGRVSFANELASTLFSWPVEELEGLPLECLIPRRFHADHKQHVGRFREASDVRPMGQTLDIWARRRDGSEIPVHISLNPWTEGTSEYVVASIRDVSHQHRAEQALRHSEQRFRIAAGHTTDLIHRADVANDVIEWFGDVDGLMSYEPGEFPRTALGWLDLVHPEDRDRTRAEVEHSIGTGVETWRFDFRILAGDGTYHHWISRGTVVGYLDNGQANLGIATIQDITERVVTREQLQRAFGEVSRLNDLRNSILESIHDPVAVVDQDGVITVVNEAWKRFSEQNGTSVAADVGVGVNYLDACVSAAEKDDGVARVLAGIRSVLEGCNPLFKQVYPCHSPALQRWFSVAVTPLHGPENGAVISHSDVTEHIQQHEKLTRTLGEVEVLKKRLTEHNVYLQEEIRGRLSFGDTIGESAAWQRVVEQVSLVAGTGAAVLLSGETGTGKELVARAVHSQSERSDHPLIKVNCAALPSTLIESELFGHEKGAFSGADAPREGRFALADKGTIFLDEIGELPLELQAKLLHVLQNGEFEPLGSSKTTRVDVRVIAATNRDLESAVRNGEFRSDLYYRLAVFPIELPPLRDRRDDIALLATYFLSRHNATHGRSIGRIPDNALVALEAYDWPGNVRELENIIERGVIVSTGSTLMIDAPALVQHSGHPASDVVTRHKGVAGSAPTLQDLERGHIVETLVSCEWKVKGVGNAADILGLKESTLRARMKKLGIRRPAA